MTPRSEAIKAALVRYVDTVFKGKKFFIVKEIHLPEGQRFRTVFGDRARHGFILEEIGAGPESRIPVGKKMLHRAAHEYGAVELPPEKPKRPRRTKVEMQAARALLTPEESQPSSEDKHALESAHGFGSLEERVVESVYESGTVEQIDSALSVAGSQALLDDSSDLGDQIERKIAEQEK